jgi:diacylglycerol kinase (ATP)
MNEPIFDKSTNTGFTHFVNATRFSLNGLVSAFKYESAFRQELLLFSFLLPSGIYCASSPGMGIALLCSCFLVLSIELLNSGIESAIDRIGPEQHELSKLAKDYGSAAVMMSLAIVVIIWSYIIYSYMQAVT